MRATFWEDEWKKEQRDIFFNKNRYSADEQESNVNSNRKDKNSLKI